jgi:acetyl-CoA carboxylase biotin carboxyl carrier protein
VTPATAIGVTTPTMAIASTESHAGITVASPMVGTFFAAPDAGSPPYIEVGSAVSPGDTLCIIEAMKIFNHVEAEYGGRIAQIFKQSGEPVEFGEALFLIDEIQTDSPNS